MQTDTEFRTGVSNRQDAVELFRSTFSAAEGESEGTLISTLVDTLFRTVKAPDLRVYAACTDGKLSGCIMFTPLVFDQDSRSAALLAPVAVRTDVQRHGIGQGLLKFGLDQVRQDGIDLAVTYGDPAFYCKVGFQPVTEDDVPPPVSLSYPHGWQAQSLTGAPLSPLKGPSRTVDAFKDPSYW